MVIRHEDLVGSFEQKKALVAQFNLMDDTFFSVVMEDKAACEYLLSALMGKPIRVIENKTQYSIRNIGNHSIVLDALVEDEEHNLYNVEVHVGDQNNHERRIRYYRTGIDWSYLEKGVDYSELPELYMIFISDFDPFKLKRNHYEIKQYVDNSEVLYDDGVHRLYFNTAVKDGTGLSKLLQYIKKSDAGDNRFGALSQAVDYHKIQSKGVDSMCKAVEEYANERANLMKKEWVMEGIEVGKKKGIEEGKKKGIEEGKKKGIEEGKKKGIEEGKKRGIKVGIKEGKLEKAVETVKNMLKENIPIEVALRCAELDRKTYEKYADTVQ